MEFRKYSSIENSYMKTELDRIVTQGLHLGDFVVQEKVHGANFSIWYDGQNFKYAKRTGFVEEGEKFYNADYVVAKYEARIQKLYEALKAEGAKVIAVFGELYGGVYPHEEVARVKNTQVIQKGVSYNPDNDFYVYDILVDGQYLTVDECNKLFEKFGFFYAKTLFRGEMEKCLEYPNEFNSKLPEWLGLPALEINICEGVVIKPVEPRFHFNGSRVILKNKNEKWSEREKPVKEKVTRLPQLSQEGQVLLEELLSFITENRLKNVLSKTGEIAPKDFGKLTGLLSQDAYEDFNKEFAAAFEALEKEEQKRIKKQMSYTVANLIKSSFKQILQGVF